MQHKYIETVLFFPSHGQTCHSYCTFCFRCPQFVGVQKFKFSASEISLLINYLQKHRDITDVLFTGGDPLVMKARVLAKYIEPLLQANLEHIQNIRIGTKALSYWPYRFFADGDSADLCELFSKIVKQGKHLAIMAHFTHPVELSTFAAEKAVSRLRDLGAQIRTQSPILRNINASAETWAEMWRKQVSMGCIPYYMFVARNTGAKHYFSLPLTKIWKIFSKAYQQVSGICRTVRGPVMSCLPGKIQVLGTGTASGQRVMTLRMIQGRDPGWVAKPFFAEYDDKATWFTELKPAFGEKRFFFESSLEKMLQGQESDDESKELE
jgi:KamA family protein